MMRFLWGLLCLVLGAGASTAQCRQALALGLDVSGSVDAREYRLQIEGLAAALGSPGVRQSLLTLPRAPVQILVYEWSGPSDQALILPWTPILDENALDGVIAQILLTERREASPGTALGVAMQKGSAYLAQRPDCWKRVLDISGDGKSNLGPRPVDVKALLETTDITINALVIGADAPVLNDLRQSEISELSAYFQANVIMGPEAFVETALGFEDYAAAMARKLERELDTIVISDAGETDDLVGAGEPKIVNQ